MSTRRPQSRRRFLQITGVAGLGLATPLEAAEFLRTQPPPQAWQWRGILFGATASIQLYGLPERQAARLTETAFARMHALEQLFSLYEPASTICQLNTNGYLNAPPPEFTRLLQQAQTFSRQTEGAFDVTVQPLWNCYRDHYSQDPAPTSPPPPDAVRAALARVGYRNLRVSEQRIAFTRPGMAVTLNGIAQGFITDQITDFLRREGVTQTLVNLGEYRAIGSHPQDRPWQLGIRAPGTADDDVTIATVPLDNAALAVSGGHGHTFGIGPQPTRHHHLMHPATGRHQPANRTIAVTAPTATQADALSTACAVVDNATARSFIRSKDVSLKIYS